MTPFALIPLWVKAAVLAAILASLGGVYAWRVHVERDVGRAEVQLKWDASVSQQRQAALETSAEYRRIESRRQGYAAEVQQRKDDEIHAINAQLDDALGRLRNRPSRPAAPSRDVPSNPAPVAACTGAQLYREDGELLTREAARAQRILTERDACYDAYSSLIH